MISSRASIKEKALRGALIALCVGTPLAYFSHSFFPHIASKTFFFQAIAQVVGGLWLYCALGDRAYRLTKRQWYLIAPLLLFVVWNTIAGLSGLNPELSLWGSLMRGTGIILWWHILVAVIAIIGCLRAWGSSYGYTLMRWSVMAGAVVALTVWIGDQGFNWQSPMLTKSSGGGIIGNSSLAAAYLLLVFFFAVITLRARAVTRGQKRALAIALIVIVTCPLFINIYGLLHGESIVGVARGALAGIGAGLVIATCVYLALSSSTVKRAVGIALIVIGTVAGILVWQQLTTPGTPLSQRFVAAASGTRLLFWQSAQEALRERPLLGYGPETFSIVFQTHFDSRILLPEYGHEAWADRAHNIIYDTGVGSGWPGIVLYIAFLASISAAAIIAVREGKRTQGEGALMIGVIGGYVLQNLFVFDGPASLALFGLTAALCIGAVDFAQLRPSERRPVLPAATWKWGITLVVGIGVYYFAYLPLQKSIAMARVMDMGVNTRPAQYTTLLRGSPVGNQWDIGGLADSVFKLYNNNAQKVLADETLRAYALRDVDSFISYAEAIAKDSQTDYRLYAGIVHLHVVSLYLGNTPYTPEREAHIVPYIERVKVLAPKNPQIYWAIAQLAVWKGDMTAAYQAYEQAVLLAPDLPLVHQSLLRFLAQTGNTRGYADALRRAQTAIPTFSADGE